MRKKYTFALLVFIGLVFFISLQKAPQIFSLTSPENYPTPVLHKSEKPATVVQQTTIGEYTIRLWGISNNDTPKVMTISAIRQEQIEIRSGLIWIDSITGSDLTSNGYPELVIRINAGGSGAKCDQVSIYSMTETDPILVLDNISTCLVPHNSRGEPQYGKRQDFFEDVNGDGTVEFITYPYFLSDMQIWTFDAEQNKYRYIKFEEEKDFPSSQEVHDILYPPTPQAP